MLHLLSSEVTALGALLSVLAVTWYNADSLIYSPSVGGLMTVIGFIVMLRGLAGGRSCPKELLEGGRQQSSTNNVRSSGSGGEKKRGRVVLVTGAGGMMGYELCKGLLTAAKGGKGSGECGATTVIVCCRTAEHSKAVASQLNRFVGAAGGGGAVAIGGCDATCLPSITAYVRTLKQFLQSEGLILDTAVLAVGMISPTLQYVDVATGKAVANPFEAACDAASLGKANQQQAPSSSPPSSASPAAFSPDTTRELMVASNSIGTHHFASLLMPLLASSASSAAQSQIVEGADGTATVEAKASTLAGEEDVHPRRLIIVASCAHTHLGAFSFSSSAPMLMLKGLHNFATNLISNAMAANKGEGGANPSKRGANPQAANAGALSPSYGLSIARSVFYPDFVKVYGLSKLINLYTGYTLIEMADKQRENFLKSRLAAGGAGIKAKLDDLPVGTAGENVGGGKIVKVVMLHPGIFGSGLYRRLLPQPLLAIASFLGLVVMKTAWESCQTALYLCLEDWGKVVHGGYYYDCKEYGYDSPVINSLSAAAMDGEERRRVVGWMNDTVIAATRRGKLLAEANQSASTKTSR